MPYKDKEKARKASREAMRRLREEGVMKRCSHCNQLKSNGEFSKDRSGKDGLQMWCKACKSDWNKQHGERSPNRLQIDTPQVLDVTRIDELLQGVDKNTALAQSLQRKCRELNLKLIEYATKIVELQNQIATENKNAH